MAAMALPCLVATVTALAVVVVVVGTTASSSAAAAAFSATHEHASLDGRCDLTARMDGDVIRPLLEVQSKVTGCFSKNVSQRSQEVHVIRVEEPAAQVQLLVQPRLERSTHAGPLVVLLWTPTPVHWQLATQRLPNSSKIEAIVGAGSAVVSRAPVSLTVVKKTGLFEDLLAWTESYYGVLTSFSSTQSANSVVLKVGVNQSEPASCNRTSSSPVSHVAAYLVEVQVSEGCSRPAAAEEDKEVHVVKLGSSLSKSSVVVQLMAKPGSALEKPQVLVLKCESHLEKWEVESEPGVQGNVEIMTENSVTSEATSYLLAVKVRTVPLPERSGDLLRTVRRLVGPANSYVQVERATRIQVYVSGRGPASGEVKDANAWARSSSSSSFSLQHFISSVAEEGKVKADSAEENGTRDVERKSGDRPASKMRPAFGIGSNGHLLWLTGRRRENTKDTSKEGQLRDSLRLRLAQDMALSCLSEKVQVAFPSPAIEYVSRQVSGQAPSEEGAAPLTPRPTPASDGGPVHVVLTLKDSSCRARRNKTHYILESPLRSCNANIVESYTGATVYRHEVLIWLLRDKQRSSTESATGKEAFLDDEDGNWDDGSGFGVINGDGKGAMAKELLVALKVQCFDAEKAGKSAGVHRLIGSGEIVEASTLYDMTLFHDPEFTRPLSQAPISLVADTVAYVHVEIQNVSDLCTMVTKCWLTNASRPESQVSQKWILLKDGCPNRMGVKLQHFGSRGLGSFLQVPCWKRFSFKLDAELAGEVLLLKCKLDACSASSRLLQAGVIQCQDVGEPCAALAHSAGSEAPGSKLAAVETWGPFGVLGRDGSAMAAAGGPAKGLPMLHSSPGEQQQLSLPMGGSGQGSTFPLPAPKATSGSSRPRPRKPTEAQQPPVVFVGVMMEAVVGIAFSSFAIGMALVAAMWYIHARTARQLSAQRRRAVTPRTLGCCRPRNFPMSRPPSGSPHLAFPLESST
uniref:Putative transforming growth factor beta receptor type 3 isoform x1 n=1 Tax=Ixodes ricinus TaxID=34613 RepID=A0A147BE24_IXORI